ncbi:MAG TPA: alkaline phosphatase family protein [Candidatus Cybelea sp.]
MKPLAQRATRTLVAGIAAALLAACSASTGGSSLPSPASPVLHPPVWHTTSSSPIAHIVLVVQENRSFDELFALFPGADGASRGLEKVQRNGVWADRWIKLRPQRLAQLQGMGHCHTAFLTSYDGGKMDGFNLNHFGVCNHPGKPAGGWAYQYVLPTDIWPYWEMASQYALADHMFQTQGSGSFTAHQDLIRGGTSIDQMGSGSGYTESLIDNPSGMPWGCDAPAQAHTQLITTLGQFKTNGPYPCSNDYPTYGSSGYHTMRDLLDAAGVSWSYYAPCFMQSKSCNANQGCSHCSGGLLNAFDSIYPVRYGSEWDNNVSMPETNIFNDISSGNLANVSWVVPEDQTSDHPGHGPMDLGPSWVASIVNAVGESQYWNTTAIFILWDDWGGFYDNAKPPFQDGQGGLGFRVPTIVVSPYTIVGHGSQGGYVSHTQYEYGSLLRFIEDNFGLGRLGTTDERAKSIGDVFNYNQPPHTFMMIPSDHDAHYFITHRHDFSPGDPE